MNRTIKEATVKLYHYDSHTQLAAHLHDFADAYNYGRRRKTLRGPDTLRIHLQNLGNRARTVYTQSAPSNAGTKDLGSAGDARRTGEDYPHQEPGTPLVRPVLVVLSLSGALALTACQSDTPRRDSARLQVLAL